jgi:transposase
VRTGLYWAAVTAARCNPGLKAFYERLRGVGKIGKVAITAVMRKLVVLANTLLREDRLWQPDHA